MEIGKGEGSSNYDKYIHHGLFDDEMLIICNADGFPAAFPLAEKNLSFVYSPGTPDEQLQSAMEELIAAGFKGPFRALKIGSIGRFGDAFDANILLDAPIKEIY